MRQLIENPVYMTIDDMRATYKGKWIFAEMRWLVFI